MSTQEPDRAPQAPALTSLPRLEDIPQLPGGGLDPDRVKDAFDGFRRHALQLQAQLRVLQAAGRAARAGDSGRRRTGIDASGPQPTRVAYFDPSP